MELLKFFRTLFCKKGAPTRSVSVRNAPTPREIVSPIVGKWDSWLANSFRKRNTLPSSERTELEEAMLHANLAASFPKYGGDFSEADRIRLFRFVIETVGEDHFLEMGPVGIRKHAEVLGLQNRVKKTKPKFLKVICHQCNTEAIWPESSAGQKTSCSTCDAILDIPRPKRGYYAEPSESQLEEAQLYNLSVSEGLHRGELKEQICAARADKSNQPTAKAYEIARKQKLERHLRSADDETKKKLLAEERQYKRDLQQDIEDGRQDAEDEIADFIEFCSYEFSKHGDWGEFYSTPSRSQILKLRSWLIQNGLSLDSPPDIAAGIDVLFPLLRK